MPSLDAIPPELLEHIAFLAATNPLLGPPSALFPFLLLNRNIHAALAFDRNPLLYARICAAKFDLAAPIRRLGLSALGAPALAAELVKRCRVLKRLRALGGARLVPPSPSSDDAHEHRSTTNANGSENAESIDELLSTAYLMVLEDEGRNAAQLRSYARMDKWLCVYWFDDAGASGAMRSLQLDRWPVPGLGAVNGVYAARGAHAHHALAMWLLWFFFEPAVYVANPDLFRRADHILKLIALNAPVYPLTRLPWTSFNPGPSHIHFGTPTTRSDEPVSALLPSPTPNDPPGTSTNTNFSITSPNSAKPHLTHFATPLPRLLPPPGAAPATLAYLALAARARRDAHDSSIFGIVGGGAGAAHYAFLSAGGLSALGGGGGFGFGFGGMDDGIGVDTMWGELLGMGGGVGMGAGAGGVMGGGDAFVAFPELGMSFAERAQMMMGGPGAISQRWECDWRRSVGMEDPPARPASAFKPGSIDGAWEGTFTYTEFHSFAALLAGCAPKKLRDCVLAQHNQTWRVREHHLLAPLSSPLPFHPSQPHSSSTTRPSSETADPSPLPIGEAISAHIPDDASFSETSEGLTITVAPSKVGLRPAVYTYQRYSPANARAFNLSETHSRRTSENASDGEERENGKGKGKESEDGDGASSGYGFRSGYDAHVCDIILTGEGHSGWGEFRIVGRVRPSDGFVSLMKEYTSGDRGRWLYRGYLIGGSGSYGGHPSETFEKDGDVEDESECAGTGGYIVGRWRDTLTPGETHGYEGAFALARRR